MKLTKLSMRSVLLAILGVGLQLDGYSQTYSLSTPITGFFQLGITDLGASPLGQSGGAIGLSFGNLSETVYFDPTGLTVRQSGFVPLIPATSNIVLNESELLSNGQTVSGVVTVHQEVVGGGLSFDTGTQPLTWDPLSQNYSCAGHSSVLGSIAVQGSYSLVTGGQTFTGAFGYTLYAMNYPPQTFSSFTPDSGQTSLELAGLTSGLNGGISVYSWDGEMDSGSADVSAPDGFQMYLVPGVSDLTDYFSWSSGTVTAVVPEPASLALLGFGLAGLVLLRRLRLKPLFPQSLPHVKPGCQPVYPPEC